MGVVCCARGVFILKHTVVPTFYTPGKARCLALLLSLFAILLLAACNQAKPTTSKPESDRVTFDLSENTLDGLEALSVTEDDSIVITF